MAHPRGDYNRNTVANLHRSYRTIDVQTWEGPDRRRYLIRIKAVHTQPREVLIRRVCLLASSGLCCGEILAAVAGFPPVPHRGPTEEIEFDRHMRQSETFSLGATTIPHGVLIPETLGQRRVSIIGRTK